MMKIIKNTKLLKLLLFIIIIMWFTGPYAKNMGDTGAWKADYASPRQYYEEDGIYLKSTTRTIAGIQYSFDDIGSVMQDENDGHWISVLYEKGYQLNSGIQLKDTWYQIDGEWYYFNDKGLMIRQAFIKVNGKRYFVNWEGKLCKGSFSVWFHKYGTVDSGEIMVYGGFYYKDNYYYMGPLGHGIWQDTRLIELQPSPRIRWEGFLYIIQKPEYFLNDQFHYVGRAEVDTGEYPQKDGESIEVALGSEIYEGTQENDCIYIYDPKVNSFYSYKKEIPVISPQSARPWE